MRRRLRREVWAARRFSEELKVFRGFGDCKEDSGRMSIIGPRPERPHFVHKFLQKVAWYNHRDALKVGITGWAQVNDRRGDTSIEKRIECDLYYLQNSSFTFDLRIIVMTISSGLINRNAY
jgi:lipopolysaccharide/colanic/teichoic acid biosynthesis glycosyltransferase